MGLLAAVPALDLDVFAEVIVMVCEYVIYVYTSGEHLKVILHLDCVLGSRAFSVPSPS